MTVKIVAMVLRYHRHHLLPSKSILGFDCFFLHFYCCSTVEPAKAAKPILRLFLDENDDENEENNEESRETKSSQSNLIGCV